METLNINRIKRGDIVSNYRLRGEPVQLVAKELVGYRPDGDGWEQVWEETSATEKLRDKMRLRGSRKQRAARQAVPLSTVKIVKQGVIQIPEVAIARLEGKSDQDVRIIEIEAQIKQLLGIKR